MLLVLYQPTEPMRNEYPHITIGMAPRVNPVVSNELLARRAATEDLQTGLQAKVLDDTGQGDDVGLDQCIYCFLLFMMCINMNY